MICAGTKVAQGYSKANCDLQYSKVVRCHTSLLIWSQNWAKISLWWSLKLFTWWPVLDSYLFPIYILKFVIKAVFPFGWWNWEQQVYLSRFVKTELICIPCIHINQTNNNKTIRFYTIRWLSLNCEKCKGCITPAIQVKGLGQDSIDSRHHLSWFVFVPAFIRLAPSHCVKSFLHRCCIYAI